MTARAPTVLLAGNPNAGKTTLFNVLTGSEARVGNYPGVTVDRRSGTWHLRGVDVELVDLPGTYSLTARSAEEGVAIDAVFGKGEAAPRAVVVVVDSTSLRRGLYFAVQVLETGVPAVLALSLADEARGLGLELDVDALSRAAGVPVVAVSAARNEGLDALAEAVSRQLATPVESPDPALVLPPALVDAVAGLATTLASREGVSPRQSVALARYAVLAGDETDEALACLSPGSVPFACDARAAIEDKGIDPDVTIVAARYAVVDAWASATIGDARPVRSTTELIDRWLTHPVVGLAVFVFVMGVVFEALYAWSTPFVSAIEAGVAATQGIVGHVLPHGALRDLVADGIVGGVGNVIVFVPQIALLFLFVTLLEDSGYLARVAFVIDRLMRGVGLHGKAFVPLLSGFACAIPAVMSTRTIENRRDRLVTMLALPLMSCSARLPVYVLIVATVFPRDTHRGFFSTGALALLALYTLSVTMTLAAAAIMRRTVLRGPRPTLVLELPPYRVPLVRNVVRAVRDRVKSFLTEAGTTILALSIVLWALLNYPQNARLEALHQGEVARAEQMAEGPARERAVSAAQSSAAESRLEHSALGRIGKGIEPALAPLGFDWRIDVGILGAFAAREVFISTLGIVFGLGGAGDETSTPLRASLRQATRSDGTALFDVPTGVSLLVFFVLACQCMSTVAVVKREAGGWKWAVFLVTYMSVLAYVGAFVAKRITEMVVGG